VEVGPGRIVRYRDAHLMVERTLRFENGDERWFEHRLSDDRLGRSLWLEIQGDKVTLYERLAAGAPPEGGPEAVHDGVAFRLTEHGLATYRSQERAGAGKQGEVEYFEYAAGERRLAYERFDGGRWEVSLGEIVDPADVAI
jgi:hypothetical protein